MPDYCQPRLEYSPDPLSDTTPSWVDVTAYLKDASWFSGVQRDLDQPQAGGAVFVLRNKNRDWEPEFPSGRFYPNILPLRRFRWSIAADGVSRPQGLYYATSYEVRYPNPGSTESDVVVTCVDGIGVLALYPLPRLDATDATTYAEVVTSDEPLAYWPITDPAGKTLHAEAGPDANVKGGIYPGFPSPILGSADPAIQFDDAGYARATIDDTGVFHDSQAFTIECVVQRTTSFFRMFLAGPYNTASSGHSFGMNESGVWLWTSGASQTTVDWPTPIGAGVHHLAATYDGSALRIFQDGVQVGAAQGVSNVVNPDASEFLYVGGSQHIGPASTKDVIGHAAFYTYALGADRIAAHASAALSRGYAAEPVGSRIAELAANPLWSTAGIPTGQLTAAARFQTGQGAFDEIVTTVQAETPYGLFYFNDNGNPAYSAWDAPVSVAATLGEQEVQYDDVGLVYDDQVYNQATVNRVGGLAQTRQNTASSAAYGTRDLVETDLIIQSDADAAMIAQAIVDQYGTPAYRIDSVTLNAAAQNRRTQILVREVGDTIRIKRRGAGGTANPDVVARILGKAKHLDVSRHLTCTWNVSRGFPATPTVARLGVTGYAELGQTFILG